MDSTSEDVGELATAPKWMAKHPCTGCDTGYGFCAQGLAHNLKCCKDCEHPGRWVEEPWTYDEVVEMWSGRDGIPPHVQQWLADHDPTADTGRRDQ